MYIVFTDYSPNLKMINAKEGNLDIKEPKDAKREIYK